MERDIFKRLKEWKDSPRRKPLVLNGARQVGKTFSLKHFGEHSYSNTAYLNFEKDEKLRHLFDGTLDPKELIKILSIYTETEIQPEKTLLIFDEIQECPKALTSLKYFCEEACEYHIAAAGSLLGVKTSQEKGFPVGKVNFLHLYPLTFFEFLSAIGSQQLRAYLENISSFEPLPTPLHEKLLHHLRFYFFVGGMPEAVHEYAKSENLAVVREIQDEILSAYEKDFAKHAPPTDIMKITTIWKEVHRQLAKENKKFVFSQIRKSARGRDYEDAIQWLQDAGLIHKSFLIETPKLPLSAYADGSAFKIFLSDIGLLGAQSHLLAQRVIDGNALFTEHKGALKENFAFQEWIATKKSAPYYWASQGIAKVDLLFEEEGEVYPVEIKGGASSKKKSLLVYSEKYSPKKLFRATTMNLKQEGALINVPLYLLARIADFTSVYREQNTQRERR